LPQICENFRKEPKDFALGSCAALPGFLLMFIMRKGDHVRKVQELLKETELVLGLQVQLESGSFGFGDSENRCN